MVELCQKCRIYAVRCRVLVLLALFPGLGVELRSGPCWSRESALLAPQHGFAVCLEPPSSPFLKWKWSAATQL